MLKRKDAVLFGLLMLAALILRFLFLGYSDYQGDEIKALYSGTTLQLDFLLDQRKGPLQFLATWALRDATGSFSDRFVTRAPFALAGFLSCILFYQFVKTLGNRRIAAYASIFFVTNGLLVALSRIVQYQSLVIFFMLLALYFAALLVRTNRVRYLYLTFIAWAVSILAHYDGILVLPMIAALLWQWLDENRGFPKLVPKIVVPALIFIVLIGVFYVPFVQHITPETLEYWDRRFTGGPSNEQISSSRYLFSVYQPIWALQIYTILGSLGLGTTMLLLLRRAFASHLPRGSRHLSETSLLDLRKLTERCRIFKLPILLGLLLWFLVPFVFLESVVTLPGTHVYAYLLPLTILMGLFLWFVEHAVRGMPAIVRYAYPVTITALYLFLFLQSYAIFVDHSKEYAWESEQFLVWTLSKPDRRYNLSVFGFPYYRHWDEIAKYIQEDARSDYYWSNERMGITLYHLPTGRNEERAGYYIHVESPQTLKDGAQEGRYKDWMESNQPVVTYENDGVLKARIYFLPEGTP